jgi:PhnB protein
VRWYHPRLWHGMDLGSWLGLLIRNRFQVSPSRTPMAIAVTVVAIGNSIVMIADECEAMEAKGPKSFGGSPVMMHLYVEDCDGVVEQAVAAGATVVREVETQFYGDRNGMVEDPYGYRWGVATRVEDLTEEEIEARAPEV